MDRRQEDQTWETGRGSRGPGGWVAAVTEQTGSRTSRPHTTSTATVKDSNRPTNSRFFCQDRSSGRKHAIAKPMSHASGY